jgi:hypothetical protein
MQRPERKRTPQSKPAKTQRRTQRFLRTDENAASDTEPALRQPDERDQSADQHTTAPRRVIQQAHDDVKQGQQDTDCRNRIPEALPDQPKTPENFDERDKIDPAPHAVKRTSK